MAIKKTKKAKRAPAPRKASRRKLKNTEPMLSPEAQRQIAAVFLGALALLLVFACFSFGGTLVTGMFHVLRVLVEFTAYLLPIMFAGLAYRLFRADEEHPVGGVMYFGVMGVIVTLSGLFHLWFASSDPMGQAQTGN